MIIKNFQLNLLMFYKNIDSTYLRPFKQNNITV